MKKSLMFFLLLVILGIWYMKAQSGYERSDRYMPMYNGQKFTDDDLAN